MHRTKLLALIAAGCVAALLALLLAAESAAPDATIVSVPSALWYLITTLTTVGYGDCYPVTAAGRVIGALFQLMSLGVFALLIGMLAAFLRGTAWERLRLWRLAGKPWYVFSEKNEASLALAEGLKRDNPKRVLLFAGTKGDCGAGKPCLLRAETLCGRKRDGDFFLFCLSENEQENERLANSVKNGRVWCRSSLLPDKLPENQQRFDPKTLCARRYWDRFPLQSKTETVLLAGDGACAAAILEQGLLRNVLDPAQSVHYVCAGDWSDFLRLHPNLAHDKGLVTSDNIINVSSYSDPIELLCAADVCISDYSSMAEDFALLGRPGYLYLPDMDAFSASRGGIYYPHDVRPYPAATSEDELMQLIATTPDAEFAVRREAFFDMVGLDDDGYGDYVLAEIIESYVAGKSLSF